MGILQNNADGRDKLEDEIKRLEETNTVVTPPRLPDVKLDEIKYNAPDDAALGYAAEKELGTYKQSGEKAIRDKMDADGKALEQKRSAYEEGKASDISALEKGYAEAVKSVDNDALKRGLARSSVAAVSRAEVEKEYLKKNADIADTYGKKISELDAEISAADSKLRAALDDFNLSYAQKLNDRIAELKAERDKKAWDVAKYNNEIRAKQAALDESRLKTESSLYTEALKQEQQAASLDKLSADERDKIYKSVYDKMDEFLASMSPQQAYLEINNHTLYREHLSNYYYSRLYDKYGRKYEPNGGGFKDED